MLFKTKKAKLLSKSIAILLSAQTFMVPTAFAAAEEEVVATSATSQITDESTSNQLDTSTTTTVTTVAGGRVTGPLVVEEGDEWVVQGDSLVAFDKNGNTVGISVTDGAYVRVKKSDIVSGRIDRCIKDPSRTTGVLCTNPMAKVVLNVGDDSNGGTTRRGSDGGATDDGNTSDGGTTNNGGTTSGGTTTEGGNAGDDPLTTTTPQTNTTTTQGDGNGGETTEAVVTKTCGEGKTLVTKDKDGVTLAAADQKCCPTDKADKYDKTTGKCGDEASTNVDQMATCTQEGFVIVDSQNHCCKQGDVYENGACKQAATASASESKKDDDDKSSNLTNLLTTLAGGWGAISAIGKATGGKQADGKQNDMKGQKALPGYLSSFEWGHVASGSAKFISKENAATDAISESDFMDGNILAKAVLKKGLEDQVTMEIAPYVIRNGTVGRNYVDYKQLAQQSGGNYVDMIQEGNISSLGENQKKFMDEFGAWLRFKTKTGETHDFFIPLKLKNSIAVLSDDGSGSLADRAEATKVESSLASVTGKVDSYTWNNGVCTLTFNKNTSMREMGLGYDVVNHYDSVQASAEIQTADEELCSKMVGKEITAVGIADAKNGAVKLTGGNAMYSEDGSNKLAQIGNGFTTGSEELNNELGGMIGVQNASDNITYHGDLYGVQINYVKVGDKVKVVVPGGKSLAEVFEGNGDLSEWVDENGFAKAYSLDNEGRLVLGSKDHQLEGSQVYWNKSGLAYTDSAAIEKSFSSSTLGNVAAIGLKQATDISSSILSGLGAGSSAGSLATQTGNGGQWDNRGKDKKNGDSRRLDNIGTQQTASTQEGTNVSRSGEENTFTGSASSAPSTGGGQTK